MGFTGIVSCLRFLTGGEGEGSPEISLVGILLTVSMTLRTALQDAAKSSDL
jgi:hypothetical protein